MSVEDGFVPTPPAVADYMASVLFADAPSADDRILFPGAGTGCLAAAVRRYCSVRGHPCPEAVAIDVSPDRLAVLEESVSNREDSVPPLSSRSVQRLRATYPTPSRPPFRPVSMDVEVVEADFLLDPPPGPFDYIIANPPYTRYSELDPEKRSAYGDKFLSAEGQFPLYMPFVEQMQRLLADDGDLVFIAPENYLVARYASAFRSELRRDTLQKFMLMPEPVFRHWKVSTVVTVLEKDSDLGKNGYFWLESFQHKEDVRDLLRDVGFRDESSIEDEVETYYKEHRATRKLLQWERQREGEDGGYNVECLPRSHRPSDDYQPDLGRWA